MTALPIDLLVVAGTALTMEDGAVSSGRLDDAAIAVHDGVIVEVGPRPDLASRYAPAATLGGPDLLAVPGLVNAHQHLTGDRLLRSTIPDDLAPGQALAEWALPAHAAHTGDDDELSATLSLVEAVCNGITTTVEAGTVAHPDRVLAAFERVGVRGTLGSWGWDAAGQPWAGPVADVLDRQRHVLDLTAGHPLVRGWVTLVGHDLMSDDLAVAASELARDHGTHLTFHLSPTTDDPDSYLARTGRRPVQHLDELGVLGPHVLVAHAVHLDDAEVDVLLARDVAVASCPWAYLRLGQGATAAWRHGELVDRGGRVALGCDSENAGDAVDVLRAAALAAGLTKDVAADPTRWGAHTALALATRRGAAAVGLGGVVGELRAGLAADIVLVDTTGPEWVPRSPDPALQLVWASAGRAVRHVVCNGRVVVHDREPTGVDRAALAAEVRERQQRLLRAVRHP